MKERRIRVVMVAPDDLPRDVWMPVSLQAFRAAVNMGAEEYGDVKAMKIDDDIYILYHRFGCFAGLEGNRMIGNRIISGTFYVVAADEDGYPRSLTTKEAQKYMSVFWDIPDFDSIDVIRAQIRSFEDEIEKLDEFVDI